jgi:hypothetical protein
VKIAAAKLREHVLTASIADWPRILPDRYRMSPADAGFGSSRFSSPSGSFRVLYAADSFSTAFAEAVVRDRYEGKAKRILYRSYLEQLGLTQISSSRAVVLLDEVVKILARHEVPTALEKRLQRFSRTAR